MKPESGLPAMVSADRATQEGRIDVYFGNKMLERFFMEEGKWNDYAVEFEGNDYTRIGTAFHSIVETGSPHYFKEPAIMY